MRSFLTLALAVVALALPSAMLVACSPANAPYPQPTSTVSVDEPDTAFDDCKDADPAKGIACR